MDVEAEMILSCNQRSVLSVVALRYKLQNTSARVWNKSPKQTPGSTTCPQLQALNEMHLGSRS